MKRSLAVYSLVGAALAVSVVAAQQAPAPPGVANAAPPPAAAIAPLHIYLRAGMKTHGPGQHDYPQFLADWSTVLTQHGAVVDGSYHFPTAQELQGVDVIVSYKGDSGYMTESEKMVLEDFLRRGGGIVAFHDTICAEDPAWFSTIYGGAKKHGETNFTLDANVPYTVVDKTNPIMEGFPDNLSLTDESFYLMTWADSPKINVLATTKIDDTPSARAGTGHVGEVVPQMWTYERTILGLGAQPYRAFVWMQGHEYKNFTNPAIEKMILRGIAWVGKRPIDFLENGRPAGRFGGGGRQGRQGGRAGAPGAGGRRGGGAGAGAPAAPAPGGRQ
ncbi:MAG TPA: ThuA domain-containing protein [Vicinamibacterales bacterium]|jgi:type 1 glutamine amidotransferase|nr:ThuA domain-containing protein [Vicinamibacterales bacterium]